MTKKKTSHVSLALEDSSIADLYQLLEKDILDSLDEELEMELDDQRLSDELSNSDDAV